MRVKTALLAAGVAPVLAQFDDTVNVRISESSSMASTEYANDRGSGRRWYFVGSRFNLELNYADECQGSPGDIKMLDSQQTTPLTETQSYANSSRNVLTSVDLDMGRTWRSWT